jgi:hypothetical protein
MQCGYRHLVFKDKTGNTMSHFIPEIEIGKQSVTGLPDKIIRFFSKFKVIFLNVLLDLIKY